MYYDHLTLLSGRAHPGLSREIAEYLQLDLGQIQLGNFPDGETSVKLMQNIRGCDVFLIQPTGPAVNENLMELLIMIDACKRASAARVTAVMPYFGYARQDRKDSGRVLITAKLVANLITKAGADRVLTMDLHTAQIQGFFDIPVDHLYAAPMLDKYFQSLNLPADDIVIVSPDEGSIKRALVHQHRLGGTLVIVDKRRANANETTQANLIGGPVQGKIALLFDDMISTGNSILGAAEAVKQHGAAEVYLSASHGVFCGSAGEKLNNSAVLKIVVTNSLPLPAGMQISQLERVSIAPLLGEAIQSIHRNESVSNLFG